MQNQFIYELLHVLEMLNHTLQNHMTKLLFLNANKTKILCMTFLTSTSFCNMVIFPCLSLFVPVNSCSFMFWVKLRLLFCHLKITKITLFDCCDLASLSTPMIMWGHWAKNKKMFVCPLHTYATKWCLLKVLMPWCGVVSLMFHQ